MEKRFTVTSTSMNTAITVSLSECGGLTYFAVQDGITVVEESAKGITTSVGDFTNGLVFVSESDTAIDETYPIFRWLPWNSPKKVRSSKGCPPEKLSLPPYPFTKKPRKQRSM